MTTEISEAEVKQNLCRGFGLSLTRADTPDGVNLMEVIHVRSGRGRGIEGSKLRWVDQYWSTDGKLLAELDPHPDESAVSTERLLAAISGAVGAFEGHFPHSRLNRRQNDALAALKTIINITQEEETDDTDN
jgi:hypothetical protein